MGSDAVFCGVLHLDIPAAWRMPFFFCLAHAAYRSPALPVAAGCGTQRHLPHCEFLFAKQYWRDTAAGLLSGRNTTNSRINFTGTPGTAPRKAQNYLQCQNSAMQALGVAALTAGRPAALCVVLGGLAGGQLRLGLDRALSRGNTCSRTARRGGTVAKGSGAQYIAEPRP